MAVRDTRGVSDVGLPVVYADETHNTGENLLDDDQPVYVVGGLHLADDLAGDIVDQVRSGAAPVWRTPTIRD